MATTQNTYLGNGTNKLFSITFPYLDTTDINVYVNGTLTTAYTFANATTIQFTTAPANGATVLLDRSTDDSDLQATFFPGSSIKAAALNYNFDQVLYLSQETANNAANQSTAGLQAQITAANNTSNNAITIATAANTTANGLATATRNRVINGGMDFWQRGTSTTTTGNTYLADRWASAFSTGGTVSQETSSLPTGSRYAWKFVASGSNSVMQMGQQIEYVNCLDLQNTTVSISFMARAVTANAGSTALTVRSRTIAGIDGVCLFSAAAVDTSVTLTTSWVRYTVSRTLAATFGALSLEFVLGSHVSGDGIMLSQIQLEPGTVATPFERRSYGQELALCQRYFQLAGNGCFGAVDGSTTSVIAFNEKFFVPMRVAPTVTWRTGATANWRHSGGDFSNGGISSLANLVSTGNAVWSQQTGFTGLTANGPIWSKNLTSTGEFMACNAEL